MKICYTGHQECTQKSTNHWWLQLTLAAWSNECISDYANNAELPATLNTISASKHSWNGPTSFCNISTVALSNTNLWQWVYELELQLTTTTHSGRRNEQHLNLTWKTEWTENCIKQKAWNKSPGVSWMNRRGKQMNYTGPQRAHPLSPPIRIFRDVFLLCPWSTFTSSSMKLGRLCNPADKQINRSERTKKKRRCSLLWF